MRGIAHGTVLQNQNVKIRASILDGSANGVSQYSEEHIVTTSQLGLFTLAIGGGMNPSGSFSGITWANGDKYLKIEMDATGGNDFMLVGVSQLLSVPYALLAEKAKKAAVIGIEIGDTILYTPSNKVGIGTNGGVFGTFQVVNPQNRTNLVVGDSSLGNTYIHMSTSSFSNGYGEIQAVKGSGTGLWGDVILNRKGGNVGIGTDNPQNKLQVEGSINAGSRIHPGYTGTEDGYSLIHFKNGTAAHGGIIRASQGNGDGGDAPLIFQASRFLFDSEVDVNGILHINEQAFIGTPAIASNSILDIGGKTRIREDGGKVRLELSGTSGPFQGGVFVYDNSGVPAVSRAQLYVATNGTGWVTADATVSAIKNFRMAYPGRPNEEIWYACIEGPEAGAYERGTVELVNGETAVVFTDHFQKVINHKTMTVQVSPLSADSEGLAIVEKSENGFKIKELRHGTGNYKVDWEVKAVRKGCENYQPVRNTSPGSLPIPTPFLGEDEGIKKPKG